MAGPVSESESEEDTAQAAPGRATVEDQEAPVDNQAAPGRAPVEDQEAPGRAQAADQLAPQAEEQAAGKSRRKTGRGRDQTRDALDAERLITAIEAVSNRVTREGLKFEMYRMVYEAKCREVDMWDEGNGVQLTTL
ncbi:unnamed protein product [Gadus morhua 'NCC']